MKKTYTVYYTETSVMSVDIEASTKEEAEEIWQEMIDEGNIDYSYLEPYESHYTIEGGD